MNYRLILATLVLTFSLTNTFGQNSPCSFEEIIKRHQELNPAALEEYAETEKRIQEIIAKRSSKQNQSSLTTATYTIPVVLHVFHSGDDAKIDMEQIQSGLDVLNQDFNGLNPGWNTIDPEFDPIKGTLDINFCLATLDPDGNQTTGVNYYNDPVAMLNNSDLFMYAWDNYKYLNIYLPKYTGGAPSNFTAYAYYPSTANTNNNRDGIFYSSIRWGYGNLSELEVGHDWASVVSHEVGHWLGLRHTFENGCFGAGDFVDDTPPSEGGTIELEGCNNYDFSCGVHTNGENFMDYNHSCKKMFTQGQIERMDASLYLASREQLWTAENLAATGCTPPVSTSELEAINVKLFPNPVTDNLTIQFDELPMQLKIIDVRGTELFNSHDLQQQMQIDVSAFASGVYFVKMELDNGTAVAKIIVE